MPILNYTTTVDFNKSIQQIQAVLAAHGATRTTVQHEGGLPVALFFTIVREERELHFALPCNYSGVLKAMERNRRVPRRLVAKDQALRVSWRILKDWVEAQMAIVEASMVEMAEVFLPYLIIGSGQALWKEIKDGKSQLLLPQ